MKYIHLLSAGLVAAAFTALPAAAQTPGSAPTAPRCIDVKDIVSTDTQSDDQTMTFKMRNGTTMTNKLMSKCDSLRFGGFVWTTAPGGEICAKSQILRAITTGELCRLGEFSVPVKTAAAPATTR
jgi:hypothetical protein